MQNLPPVEVDGYLDRKQELQVLTLTLLIKT